jgi:hypothetical protein
MWRPREGRSRNGAGPAGSGPRDGLEASVGAEAWEGGVGGQPRHEWGAGTVSSEVWAALRQWVDTMST